MDLTGESEIKLICYPHSISIFTGISDIYKVIKGSLSVLERTQKPFSESTRLLELFSVIQSDKMMKYY